MRIDGDSATQLDAPSRGRSPRSRRLARLGGRGRGAERSLAELDYAPLVPRPRKIICGGMNYRSHIAEAGMEVPAYPTLFAKYAPSLIGAGDDIALPPESEMVDWEAELAVIVGARGGASARNKPPASSPAMR